ncbi:hypothetical protein [Oceanivirga miroungae]|uniref:Uncharacterized protein n=1 Tax=Oceanivirga miroungae TaxID=1130046 RepID=A0A6I8MDX4_9FUSO|nr:hypothetical protein [Oceanivirga miroungae]VWL85291.1 hypothetical protein OMES3154_00574 [Oceanivirga miroungae]
MKKWNLVLFIYVFNILAISLFISKIFLDQIIASILAVLLVYEFIYFMLSIINILKNKDIKMLEYKKEMNIYFYLSIVLIISVFILGFAGYYKLFAYFEIAIITLFLEFINPMMYDSKRHIMYYGNKKVKLDGIVEIVPGFNKLVIKYNNNDSVSYKFTSEKRKRDFIKSMESLTKTK